jgi:hypothetical protein
VRRWLGTVLNCEAGHGQGMVMLCSDHFSIAMARYGDVKSSDGVVKS